MISSPVRCKLCAWAASRSLACPCFRRCWRIYGVAGIFSGRKIWRAVVFVLFGVGSLFGGYRSILIGLAVTFVVVFWLEGSIRTNLFPTFIICGLVVAALALPFVDRCPFPCSAR